MPIGTATGALKFPADANSVTVPETNETYWHKVIHLLQRGRENRYARRMTRLSSFRARLQADLQKRGITVWSKHHGDTPDTPDQENTLRQAIRAVDVVVLVLSSHTRTSRIIREHLRIAALYQRQLVYVWATDAEWIGVEDASTGGGRVILRKSHTFAEVTQIGSVDAWLRSLYSVGASRSEGFDANA